MTSLTVDGVDVVVGVVTHRRPAPLGALLERLVAQEFPDGQAPRIGVVVVDNSPQLEGRPVVERLRACGRLPVHYVPLGAGNISRGRNRVLQEACASAPLVALVDDDELPEADWLHRLLDAQRRTAADVVSGPVVADHPSDAPRWVRRPEFHSVPGPATAGWVEEAYTCNVLLRSAIVLQLGLRFDDTLGVSGGEDQLFFRQAHARGARIYFEPSAVVHDPVVPERLTVSYLLRREFRMGGTLGLLDRSRPGWPEGRPGQRVLRAGWWTVRGAAAVTRAALRRDRAEAVLGSMRIARAAGMVHGLLGGTYGLYATAAAPPRQRPVVALVANEGPDHQVAGHSRHLQGLLSHLCAEGYRVVVVVPGSRTGLLFRRRRPGEPAYLSPAIRTVGPWQVTVAPRAVGSHLAWQVFRRLPHRGQRTVDGVRSAVRARRHVDHVLGTWFTPVTSAWVTRTLARLGPDAVLFNTVFTVPDPLVLPPSVRLRAVISHDVVHERAASFTRAGHRVRPVGFAAADEAARLAAVDTVVAIQWDDAHALARLAPHARIAVTPVVVDAGAVPREDAVPGRCLFVGSGSLHNVEAVTWFLRHCWPAVLERRPESRLHVIGTVCARLPSAPPGVVLRGEVDDLAEEYRQAQVVVAPLQAGSGLKVKVVEAMCHGLATVTTSVGAQGLGHVQPRPYAQADDAEGFTAAVAGLLADTARRRRLEEAALSAAPLFSSAQAFRELDRRLVDAGLVSPHARVVEAPCPTS